MTVRLIALHGFLGRAADWDRLAHDVPGVEVHAVDLWKVLGDAGVRDWTSATAALDRELAILALAKIAPTRETGPGPISGLAETARRKMGPGPISHAISAVPESARPEMGPGPISGAADSAFVVGYSLGARLALGSRFLSSPGSPVRGCCFVSCNPGLADADSAGRAARRASDETWARRFLLEPEASLWQAWDAQPVFAGSSPPPGRRDLPAPRSLLARALTACSLAGQPDLRQQLRSWPAPVLWVTGARDAKFGTLAREMESVGLPAEFVSCGDAGHRVPWDHPPAFAAVLGDWVARHAQVDAFDGSGLRGSTETSSTRVSSYEGVEAGSRARPAPENDR